MYREIVNASKKTGVPTKKILDLIYKISSNSGIQLQNVYKLTGLSKSSINSLTEILSNIMTANRNTLELAQIAQTQVRKTIEENYVVEEDIFSFLVTETYKETVNLLKNNRKQRPEPNRSFDQFFATEETTAKRASLLNFFADIKNKRILLLGDDDMLSVGIAMYKTADEVVVLDIDENILNPIETTAKSAGLRISTDLYDANLNLSKNYKGQFDVVFIDPPYTQGGIELFVSRAIESLDQHNNNARIYLCYGNSDRAKEKFLPIQDTLNKSGLYIRWVFDKFNRYDGAESIGSTSSLYILEKTQQTKPSINGQNKGNLYTNQ